MSCLELTYFSKIFIYFSRYVLDAMGHSALHQLTDTSHKFRGLPRTRIACKDRQKQFRDSLNLKEVVTLNSHP
jgi:hypothetical protein